MQVCIYGLYVCVCVRVCVMFFWNSCAGNSFWLNTMLTHLRLFWSELVDTAAHELAWALERNKTLKTLYLGSNNIGSDGARHQRWSETTRSRYSTCLRTTPGMVVLVS
jgi:hypothetical protein